jgi:lipopolysaccharide heptosyltransferase I
VLIVRTGAMGDIIHALPAITALREAHPNWYLGWVVEPRWRALLCAESKPDDFGRSNLRMPLVDQIHRANTRRWSFEPLSGSTLDDIFRIRRELKKFRYDVCIDLQGSIRSSIIGRWSGAQRRIGANAPRESVARYSYNERVPTYTEHVIEQALELAGTISGEKLAYTRACLPRDEYAESWCEQFLPREGTCPIVLMNPGAGWGAKQWPAVRYGEVAKSLSAMGYCVIVNTGPMEESLAAEVVRASGRTAMTAECNVSQLISLTRRATVMIAGDTGPLHLACALGKPVVGIFGPTDPARNGPYGSEFRVLRSPLSKRDHSRKAEPEAGLLTITPEAVLGATVELLQNSSRTSA